MPRLRKKKADYGAVNDGDLRQAIDLNEFMHGVGRVMKLPQKTPPTPQQPVVAIAEPPQKPRSRTVWISMSTTTVIVLGLLVAALIPDSNDPLPPQLIGRWYAASPRYAERGFEFRAGELFMKRGPEDGDLVRLVIEKVRVSPKNGSLNVEIGYLENGAPLSLRLTLHDYAGLPVVELRNLPDVVWRKFAPASSDSVLDLLPAALNR
ncbi:MAG: hypothetical protein ACT4P6_08775 [Gemmatimonadaceae bacterium]